MALRPEIEARVRAAEETASSASIRVDSLCSEIDEICESIAGGKLEAVPDEIFEDTSVVNHVEDMTRTASRVRRETKRETSQFNASFVAVRKR